MRLLFAIATMFGLTNSALAYRTLADDPDIPDDAIVVWEEQIVLELSERGLDPLRRSPVETILSEAIATWRVPDCAEVAMTATGSTPAPARPNDGRNTIEWVTRWDARGFESGAAATTDLHVERTGDAWRIVEADVYINGGVRWDVFDRGDGTTSLGAALVHELGHVLGLAHPCEGGECTERHLSSALYPTHQSNAGALSGDDVEGLCSLYARGGCVVSCDAGSVCSEGACVPSDELACSGPGCGMDLPLGATCDADAECRSRLCAEGSCTHECASNDDCAMGTECGPGRWCRSTMLDRAICDSGADCSTGLCLAPSESVATCTNECLSDFECLVDEECREVDGASVCALGVSAGCSAGGMPAGSWPAVIWMLALAIGRRRNGVGEDR